MWIRVFPDKPITKKPIEVRMGSGKGNVEYWVAQIQPGRMIYEIEGVSEDVAREAFRLAAAKLSVTTHIRDPDGALMELKQLKSKSADEPQGPPGRAAEGALRAAHAEGHRPARQTHEARRVRREIARVNTLLGAEEGDGRDDRTNQRSHTVEGRVVSNKMDKTVTVLVGARSSTRCTASTSAARPSCTPTTPRTRATRATSSAWPSARRCPRPRTGAWSRSSPAQPSKQGDSHDPDAELSRRRRQLGCQGTDVHQGAGRLQAPLRRHRRHHQGLGEGRDPRAAR